MRHLTATEGKSMRVINQIASVLTLLLPMLVQADGTPIEVDANAAKQPVNIPATTSPVLAKATARLSAKPLQTMQVYASDKAAEVLYERSGPVFSLNNSRASASFLFNEIRDNAIIGSIMYDAEPEFIPGVTLSFGSKLFAGLLAVENADVVGLAASIEAAYQFPIRQFPLKLSAAASYAPDILTFGQSDRIIDWNVRSSLALTKNIDGFVGLRFLQFDTRPGDRELDKKIHLGIRWNLDS